MSEMVERVARAIARENGDDYDAVPKDKSHWMREHGWFGDRSRDVNEPYQVDYDAMARAAMAAMREPTELMVDRGAMIPFHHSSYDIAEQMWQAMIDEAAK